MSTKTPSPKKKRRPPSSPARKKRATRGGSAVTHGAVTKCSYCGTKVSYMHRCPICKKVFHNICMLSMNKATNKMCIDCFEEKQIDQSSLDGHDHAPFSPGCFVPFHPFTKKYLASVSCKRQLQVSSGDADGAKPKAKPKANAKKRATPNANARLLIMMVTAPAQKPLR